MTIELGGISVSMKVFGTGSSRCGGAQAASDDDDVLSERPEEPTTAKPTNHWLRYIAV